MQDRENAPGLREGCARTLWIVAEALLVALPLAVVVASRAGTLVVALAGLAAFVAAALDGDLPAIGRRLRESLRTFPGVCAALLTGFALVSIAWSYDRAMSLRNAGELAAALVPAIVLALTMPRRLGDRLLGAMAAALGFACIWIHVELWTDLAARRSLGVLFHAYVFNRPILTILAIAIPVAWLLARRGRPVAALGLAALVAMTVLRGESGAAVLGLAGAIAVFACARLFPRASLVLAGAALIATFAAAPFAGDLAQRVLPSTAHERMQSTDSRERVAIWRSFGAAVAADPWRGAGFGTSDRFHEAPVAALVPPDMWQRLGSGHPHSAPLQIWAELGIVGVALVLALCLGLLRRLSRLPAGTRAPMLALAAAVLAASSVGHGAWQGWWPAAIGVAVVWFRFGRVRSGEEA